MAVITESFDYAAGKINPYAYSLKFIILCFLSFLPPLLHPFQQRLLQQIKKWSQIVADFHVSKRPCHIMVGRYVEYIKQVTG